MRLEYRPCARGASGGEGRGRDVKRSDMRRAGGRVSTGGGPPGAAPGAVRPRRRAGGAIRGSDLRRGGRAHGKDAERLRRNDRDVMETEWSGR